MKKLSQEQRILHYLMTGRGLTPLQALKKWGCFRLSGRIFEIKKWGYGIESHLVKRNGKRFAEYYMNVGV